MWTIPKECEKLFVEKKSKPLPLPTLKLSEPPGAVRPDGNQPSLQYACPRTVTSDLITNKSNRNHAVERSVARDADRRSSAGKTKKIN